MMRVCPEPARPAARHRAELGEQERELLLRALDVRDTPPLIGPQATRALDFRAIVATARAGKFLALLAQRVATEHIAISDPEPAQELRDALEHSAVYNASALVELSEVARLLRERGIEAIALKGAALIAQHYPRPAMRQLADLDLLVDPEHFDDAVALLRARGFRYPEYTDATSFDGQSYADALNAPHWHACAPLNAPSGVQVDLHRRLPTSGFARRGGLRGLLDRAQRVSVHGVSVPICGPADLALHLCEHFAVQHHAHPSDAPRLLADLRALYPQEPPWHELLQGPLPQRLAVMLARTLYRAAFHGPGPRDRMAQLWRGLAIGDPVLFSRAEKLSELRGYLARFAVDLVERPGFALRKLVPARAYMTQRYAVSPESPRLYALYLARLLRLAGASERR